VAIRAEAEILRLASTSIRRHNATFEAMANPDPSTHPRPTGHRPSEPGARARDPNGEPDPVSSGPLRWLLLAAGFVFVGLAGLGAALPVLPTVPFLLVAAACFARSSDRFYHWLLANRVFGPTIRDWRETRSMPLRAKVLAITMVVLVGGSSVVFWVANPWAQLAVTLVLLGLIGFLLSTPTSERRDRSPVDAEASSSERT
jgi:uncharacterized membrane protein YbaN (DUF454 family)